MITERDLEEAIAECKGVRDPTAPTCIKLAAFYIIRDHLYPRDEGPETRPEVSASFSPAPERVRAEIRSGTEFAEVVNAMDPAAVWPIIDELMTVLQAVQPKLYAGVLRKLRDAV